MATDVSRFPIFLAINQTNVINFVQHPVTEVQST